MSPPPNVPTKLDDARIISNSEVDSFLTCERKHFLSFGFNRESKHPSESLGKGILGHELLAEYYRSLQGGATKLEARQEAMKFLSKVYIKGDFSPEVLTTVQLLVSRYIENDTLATGAKILEVEKDFYLPINDQYWYGMRLDLLVQATVGRLQGQVLLIDHKFTYDFYSPDDLLLNPQMPKYVGTVRFNGYPVAEAYLNQLRTRFHSGLIPKKTDEDLFKRMPVGLGTMNQARVANAIKTQMKASERILEKRSLPLDLWFDDALPVQNKMICRSCPFKTPCQMMETNIPPAQALGGEFQKRSYGYALTEGSDG